MQSQTLGSSVRLVFPAGFSLANALQYFRYSLLFLSVTKKTRAEIRSIDVFWLVLWNTAAEFGIMENNSKNIWFWTQPKFY